MAFDAKFLPEDLRIDLLKEASSGAGRRAFVSLFSLLMFLRGKDGKENFLLRRCNF